MIITILGMQKEYHVMDVAGASSANYRFTWNIKTGRYEFRPKSQEEIDDIFQTCSPYSFVYFAPILEATDAPLPPLAKPTIERGQYETLARPDLLALAKNCGLAVRAGDDDTVVKRLLDCYFIGQGVKEELAKVSSPKAPAVAQDVPDLDLDTSPDPTPQRASGKPRRAAVPA